MVWGRRAVPCEDGPAVGVAGTRQRSPGRLELSVWVGVAGLDKSGATDTFISRAGPWKRRAMPRDEPILLINDRHVF